MKRKLWIILALAALLLVRTYEVALADRSGTCGSNVTWALNISTGTLTISGTGPMADYYEDEAPWYAARMLIQSVVIENGVTSIGEYAFYTLSNLTSVTIPDRVTRIKDFAFCAVGLSSITIPNSVTGIEYSAFFGCKSLTSVNIPYNVTSIADEAFRYCRSLSNVVFGGPKTTFTQNSFEYCASDLTL